MLARGVGGGKGQRFKNIWKLLFFTYACKGSVFLKNSIANNKTAARQNNVLLAYLNII